MRRLTLALLALAGLAEGVLGPFVHALTWHAGPVAVPVGWGLALATLAALLEAARSVARTRVGVSTVAAAWLIPVLVFAAGRPEGDIVLAGNLTGGSFVLVGVVVIGVQIGRSVRIATRLRSSEARPRSTRCVE